MWWLADVPVATQAAFRTAPGLEERTQVLQRAPVTGIDASPQVEEAGAVTPRGSSTSRAERRSARDDAEAQARANRQQLLFQTLQDLQHAAARAEREGDPQRAAALRHRSEVLRQRLSTD